MDKLLAGIETSLINRERQSDSYYQHILINNRDHTMLNMIKKLLRECDEFYFSVAFVTMSGVQLLKKTLIDAKERGVTGKIVTGNYLYFTDPEAIKQLGSFDNIETKISYNDDLHTKGYFFRIKDEWKIIVGSSNLTTNALMKNNEWNLLVTSKDKGKIVDDSISTFNTLFESSRNLNDVIDDYISKYTRRNEHKRRIDILAQREHIVGDIVPNRMQLEALKSLKELRSTNETKGLIISATGSGKTYLSAFDVKAVNPKKCLFVVHSNNILEDAKKTFETVINDKKMGIFNGEKKEIDDDVEYIFANISTLSKEDTLPYFNKNEFDYIIIDEVHKAGANSYRKIIDYFTPKFLLGMSATPERNDEFNVYELFDHNVAYEIRMKEAINQDLIVPFHYYGVTDIYSNEKNDVEFNEISINDRVTNILNKSELYGYHGDKVRGLIFVSRIDEAVAIANVINTTDKRAIALTGKNSTSEREEVIRRIALTKNDDDYIDYIVIVDIFNEGIDIPSINQVLLLRETQSKIIYVQQIGRGLRKRDGKDYLVIIDFIGNYKNNFLIPSALSGENSFDLDKVKNIVIDGTVYCPDGCTLEFEKVAQDIVLENISKNLKAGNASLKKLFITDFKLLEQRLDRMPLLMDFYENNLFSPEHIVKIKHKNKTLGYNESLEQLFNYELNLSDKAKFYLKVLYSEFSIMKRVHESVILRSLLKSSKTIEELNSEIEELLHVDNQMFYTKNAIDHLSDDTFDVDNTRVAFRSKSPSGNLAIIDKGHNILSEFRDLYINELYFKILVDDLIETNINYSLYQYRQNGHIPLSLHHEYVRKEIFHLIGDDHNQGISNKGYRYFKNTNSVYILTSLERADYANKLISPELFLWSSQTQRVYGKSEMETDLANNLKTTHIFLRKSDGENLYYMGTAKVVSWRQETTEKNGKIYPIIKYEMKFDNLIPDYLYSYLETE